MTKRKHGRKARRTRRSDSSRSRSRPSGWKPGAGRGKPLLLTTTGDPYQPVRIFYTIPDRTAAIRRLEALECIDKHPTEQVWGWSYCDEAADLAIGPISPGAMDPAAAPILIGKFRFPTRDTMTLDVRSFERAIAAVPFFAPVLGPDITPCRVRVLNRWVERDEARKGLAALDRMLDRNVTVIDEAEARKRLEEPPPGGGTTRDVPRVEDFPLHPEEETPDFLHFSTALRFRLVRAYQHWRGNDHLTLADIIRNHVENAFIHRAREKKETDFEE